MLETIGRLANRVADYTIGTVIVLVHVTMADRRGRPRLMQSTEAREPFFPRPHQGPRARARA